MTNFPLGTVLCVDDELPALDLRRKVLEARGYRVLIATTPAEALRYFDSEDIDLVLTDHLLRGQTGTALAAEMKRRKPQVAVAIYSGVAEAPDDIHNADLFITKLVSPEELLAHLEAIITAKRTAKLQRGPPTTPPKPNLPATNSRVQVLRCGIPRPKKFRWNPEA